MEVFLNRIDGIDDAIISMFESKRTLTRDLEMKVRNEVLHCSNQSYVGAPFGALTVMTEDLNHWLKSLLKWGTMHITMLRFIDLSFTVYGMHRAGQDDIDSHAKRMENRIIRSSTRLSTFKTGEMSDYYKGKIISTDMALNQLGIDLPEEIEQDGQTYVRAVNGYILKGMEDSNDVKRGLYMLSIPSSFIFRINVTEFAHVYKLRNSEGTANPEVKEAVESMANQVSNATKGYIGPIIFRQIQN